MLFLAVTLGFLVENKREHIVEHKREKEYVNSMLEDLKKDTANFSRTIKINARACNSIDTLISLLKRKDRKLFAREIYYLARFIPFDDPFLVCQNKTFEQLKNSGGLRLIRNADILNEISSYYQNNKFIETGPTLMQYQNRRDLLVTYDLLFDAAVFQQMLHTTGTAMLDKPEGQVELLSNDPQIINTVCTRFHTMYSTKKVVISSGTTFIKEASVLIARLQKHYRID